MFAENLLLARSCATGCQVTEISLQVEQLLVSLRQARGMSKLYDRIILDTRELTVEEAARLCNMSHSDFRRKFRAIAQLSFHKFLLRLRLLSALNLVTRSELPITQIAHGTGFESLGALEYSFRAFLKCSPTECRRCSAGSTDRNC